MFDNTGLRHFRGLGFLNGSYMFFACWIQKCISFRSIRSSFYSGWKIISILRKKIIKIFVFLISIFKIQNQTYIDRKCTNYTYNDAQVPLMWNSTLKRRRKTATAGATEVGCCQKQRFIYIFLKLKLK